MTEEIESLKERITDAWFNPFVSHAEICRMQERLEYLEERVYEESEDED